MAKVSVVVPVYNVEKYIEQCLNSILNQTFSDIEIVLVDDKSPDNCPLICDRFSEKDKRIKVVHHEKNIGTNGAVMSGIANSTSEFILFADSDDWLESDYVETLYREITGAKVDGISTGLDTYEGKTKGKISLEQTRLFSKKDIEKDILEPFFEQTETFNDVFGHSRCGKIFKADILKQAAKQCNEKLAMGEDIELIIRFLSLSESVKTVSDYSGYCYRIDRDGSMMNNFGLKRFNQEQLFLTTIKELAKQQGREGRASSLEYLPQNDRIKRTYWQLPHFLNSTANYEEKMYCVDNILDRVSELSVIENSVHELFLYLCSNIKQQDKLRLFQKVVERIDKTTLVSKSQKDWYYTSYLFKVIESGFKVPKKLELSKSLKQKLSSKKYIMEFAKGQSFKGKVSCVLIYLNLETVLIKLLRIKA